MLGLHRVRWCPAVTAAPKKKSSTTTIVIIVIAIVLLLPCVIGVLAAVAIPAFVGYVRRSKTAEASTQLSALYQGAAAYYEREHIGPGRTVLTHCVVGSERTPNVPGPSKTILSIAPGSSFDALGFTPLDPLYYQYEIVSVGGCGHPPDASLYSFRAHGDLDDDGVQSLFELTAGSDASNALYRSAGIYRENELE